MTWGLGNENSNWSLCTVASVDILMETQRRVPPVARRFARVCRAKEARVEDGSALWWVTQVVPATATTTANRFPRRNCLVDPYLLGSLGLENKKGRQISISVEKQLLFQEQARYEQNRKLLETKGQLENFFLQNNLINYYIFGSIDGIKIMLKRWISNLFYTETRYFSPSLC